MTLPGFSSDLVSKARFTLNICSFSSGENCTHMLLSFSTPTPCSPVTVPPMATLVSRMSAPKSSQRCNWSASFASNRISGCRLPSPAWNTLAQRRPYFFSISAIASRMSARRLRGMVESMHM
ncbi:hypothetical protein D9M69_615320 [compost metagenome]